MRVWFVALRIVILLIVTPQVAFAYKVGDVDVKVSANAVQVYDDNITSVKWNKKSDAITNLNLGLSAYYEGKLQTLSAQGTVRHQFFNRYSNFDNTQETLGVTYTREMTKFDRLAVRNNFTHSEEPTSFEDEFGRTTGRYTYYQNNFGIDYTHDVTSQLSLITRFSNQGYWPSRSDLSDSFQNQLGVEADYAISSRTITYLTYDHIRRDFYPGAEASFNVLGTGIRQYFTTQLYADLRTGLDFINSYTERRYAKPFYTFSLTDEFDATSRAVLSFSKQYTTNTSTQDLFNQWQTSLSFIKQLLERLTGSINSFYGRGEYANLRIKDRFVGTSLALDYALFHNTKASVQYSFSSTSSNFDDRDYIRKYVGFGIKIEF